MRLRLLLILVTASVLAMQLGQLSTARAELIGYWPFDSVEEVGGVRITPDGSGGGHDGVLSDTAELFDDTGPNGRGTVMNFGAFGNNAVVELPTFPQDERSEAGVDPDKGPGFNAIVESQNATISYWFNRQGEPPTDQWTFLFDDAGNRQLGSHAPWSNSNVYFDVSGCCGANQRINVDMGGADTDGQWHNLTYVKRKDDGWDKSVTAIYLDGNVLVSSPGWPDDPSAATIDDVVPITLAAIGAASGGGNSQNGLIDEFCIWNETLDQDRIDALAGGAACLSPPPGVRGDFNVDGVLDEADFNIMASNFNQRFTFDVAYSMGDFDQNLRVDLKDFIGFREAFNAGGQLAAVPEPSTFALLAMACGALLGVRRRRHSLDLITG